MKEQILVKKFGEEKVNKLWDLDPTPNKKYINWILTLDKKVSIREEDYYKFPETLDLFHENKHKMEIPKRDILNYSSLSAVYSVVEKFEEVPSKREEESSVKERAYKESVLHHRCKDLVIVEPQTEFASCFFGKGTQWCTAATLSDNVFNEYKKRGESLFIFMLSDGRKFQGCTSGELMDASDKEVEFYDFLTHEQINYVPVAKVIVKVNPCLLKVIKNQTPEICWVAVKQDGFALKYVENQTPNLCLEAVKQAGHALLYVKNQTPEICLAAVRQDGFALQNVKEQTPEICLAAVKENWGSLHFVEDQTHEICLAAVKKNWMGLAYVKIQTPEICLEAVKQNWGALRYVENQTLNICLTAVRINSGALAFVIDKYKEECQQAIS